MNVRIMQLLEGARAAKGVAVIIDVFRAFSVESYLFAHGVNKIIPVADLKIAYEYKEKNPDFLLAGERGGAMCDGFDFGNSPAQVVGKDLSGKTVVHTTSAGTQGLFGAKDAEVVLGASLVNAAATAKYIKDNGFSDVTLVCMGLAGKEETEEDNLCAEYIKSILMGEPISLEAGIENLKVTSGAKFFDKENTVFPEEDFYLCVEADKFPFALRLVTEENGERYMEKIVTL